MLRFGVSPMRLKNAPTLIYGKASANPEWRMT